MEEIYNKLDIPDQDKATAVSKNEAAFIYEFLKKNDIKKTLEVGFAYGCATAHIIEATKSPHYVMDPFQENYHNLGLKNIDKLGLTKFLNFDKDFSHNVLPKLLQKSMLFDFAFVDGGHLFDEIFIDFYYIDLLLEEEGYVLFHDSWMRSTQHIASWIKNNKKNYKVVKLPIKNFVLFQKKGDYHRDWFHFKSFYTSKSILSNALFKIKRKFKGLS